MMNFYLTEFSSWSSFEKAFTSGQTKTGLGPRIYSFVTQDAVVPESDAGSNGVKPALSSSSNKVKPRDPLGARCVGYVITKWSVVCSEAPHSQFGEGRRPHLCMNKWNDSTPVRRRLSLTQAVWRKLISISLALVLGMKTRSLDVFTQYSAFHL